MKRAIVLISLCLFFASACKNKLEKVELNSKSADLSLEIKGEQPYLTSYDNKLVMSYTERINDSLFSLNIAELDGDQFAKTQELARGKDWFVNWADFPTHAINNNQIAINYLKKSAGATYAYDIKMVLQNKIETGENKNFKLHNDSTQTEHGFVSILPYNEAAFFVTWLDGRNTEGGGHGGGDGHDSQGAMNIRAATIAADGQIIDDFLVDAKTCDCCQTSAAITNNGPVILYRDRSDDEIRDIYISRLLDGSWTIPQAIYNDEWKINGCPVNGPKADAIGNTLVVAWFTAAENQPKIKLSFSNDNGATFKAPIVIDNGKSIGRVDVSLIDADNALLSWMESTEDGAQIKASIINMEKGLLKEHIISELSASRASGFPQIEILNNKVYFAWNHFKDDKKTIKLKSLDLALFN